MKSSNYFLALMLNFILATLILIGCKEPYEVLRLSIDKNDTISAKKTITKTPYTKSGGLKYAIDKNNIAMINFLIENSANVDDGLIYAAKKNNIDICKIFLEKSANPNFLDTEEEQFYFKSIYIIVDKKPQLVAYKTDEKGECFVPFENYESPTLESYLTAKNKVIKYHPIIGRRTSMYYAIENKNIQLIRLLNNYGYNFSVSYIVKPMKHNIPSGLMPEMIFNDILYVANAGKGPIRTNDVVINVGDPNIYTTIAPSNAVIAKPLQHAIIINADKDIIDLLQSLSK